MFRLRVWPSTFTFHVPSGAGSNMLAFESFQSSFYRCGGDGADALRQIWPTRFNNLFDLAHPPLSNVPVCFLIRFYLVK